MIAESAASWAEALAAMEPPVLAQTSVALRALAARRENVSAREIAALVARDPLAALQLMRRLKNLLPPERALEVTTAESAVVMLGVEPFLAAFASAPVAEAQLAVYPAARRGLARAVARARTAALHAAYWAALRGDLEVAEIAFAALLYEAPEILLWCDAPERAHAIERRARRSGEEVASREVLGCSFSEIRVILARRCGLPPLLREPAPDQGFDTARTQALAIATALARHSLDGWETPLVAQDYRALAELLHVGSPEAERIVFETAVHAAAEQLAAGVQPVWLPPLPPERGAEHPPAGLEALRAALHAGVGEHSAPEWRSASGARAATALCHALRRGLDCCAALIAEVDGPQIAPLYCTGEVGALRRWHPRCERASWLGRALAGEAVAVAVGKRSLWICGVGGGALLYAVGGGPRTPHGLAALCGGQVFAPLCR